MGNEGRGLRPLTMKRCTDLVMIPRRGQAESLNVSVATGILLSHLLSTD
jgi:23S rRNA (guanosine2251-2'-O)-methyltransferase